MSDLQKTIKFENFKLNVFKSLMEQSLMVDDQLMLNVNKEIFKSCSFSTTKTFIKLWSIPLKSLLIKPEIEEGIIDFDEKPEKVEELDFKPFDFYILRGDLFKKFLTVFDSDVVDIEFTVQFENDKYQARTITITGKGTDQTVLKTTFILTTEELISNKIDDYSEILKQCTPDNDMFEFILSSKQMQEIKRLIKNLHKSMSDNSAFLTFKIDSENKKIVVNDKVFVLDIRLSPELQSEIIFPKESFSFNILKSDFIMTGNHDFTIYINNNNSKIILGARYANSIIWGLATKVEASNMNITDAALESTIDTLDIAEYLND